MILEAIAKCGVHQSAIAYVVDGNGIALIRITEKMLTGQYFQKYVFDGLRDDPFNICDGPWDGKIRQPKCTHRQTGGQQKRGHQQLFGTHAGRLGRDNFQIA